MIEITPEILRALCPKTPKAKRDRFLEYFNEALPRYEIDTLPRIAAFLATVCFESQYLLKTKETRIVNPKNANQARVKKMQDKYWSTGYFGRGLIQLTHEANYQAFTDATGIDVVSYPKFLEEPIYAVESACWFWKSHNLNHYADQGNFSATQGIVNRGSAEKKALDYSDRQDLYAIAVRVLQASQNTPSTRPLETPPANQLASLAEGQTPASGVEATPASSQPFFTNVIDKCTAPIITAKDRLSQIGVDPASISKPSFWKTVAGHVVGWPALFFGFITDHWEYILAGLVLLALAYLVFFGAKRNATNRVVAFVQDPGASK